MSLRYLFCCVYILKRTNAYLFISLFLLCFNVSAPYRIFIGSRVHIAVSKYGLNVALYVNGQLSTHSASSKSVAYLNSNLVFGCDYRIQSNYFKGTMDTVAFYSQSLSDSEVSALYNYGLMSSSKIRPLNTTTNSTATTITLSPTGVPVTSTSGGGGGGGDNTTFLLSIILPVVLTVVIGVIAICAAYHIYYMQKSDRRKYAGV
jgi:hypothetical protein